MTLSNREVKINLINLFTLLYLIIAVFVARRLYPELLNDGIGTAFGALWVSLAGGLMWPFVLIAVIVVKTVLFVTPALEWLLGG